LLMFCINLHFWVYSISNTFSSLIRAKAFWSKRKSNCFWTFHVLITFSCLKSPLLSKTLIPPHKWKIITFVEEYNNFRLWNNLVCHLLMKMIGEYFKRTLSYILTNKMSRFCWEHLFLKRLPYYKVITIR
jgi:hypothetical protein